jgi:hypothetical protein
VVPAGAGGYAIAMTSEPFEGLVILLQTTACEIARVAVESGAEINLVISNVPSLDRVTERIDGPELADTDACRT